MEVQKNIVLKLPEDIDNVELNMMQYRIAESRNAYLKLVRHMAMKYYIKENTENDELTKYNLSVIDQAIDELKEHLEKERRDNKPLGYMFNDEVVDIELDMYDSIEEQIEYLKRKIREFDIATINGDNNEYDDIKNKLKQNILSRYSLLKNKNCDWDDFIFDGLWTEIVDSHFDPYRINNAIDRVGKNKTANFREFIKENFKRFTIDEWIKDYDTKDKLARIDRINKDDRLSEEEKHHKTVNIWNDKFLNSDLGRETLSRLRLFEEKFVKNNSNEMIVEREKVKDSIDTINTNANKYDEITDHLKTLVAKREIKLGSSIKKEIENINDGSLDLKNKIIKLEKLYAEQRENRWVLSDLYHKGLKSGIIETELRQTDENMNDCKETIKNLILKNFENDKKQIYETVKTDSKTNTYNFEYKLILAHMNVLSENDRLDYLINVKNEIDKIKKIEEMYRDSQFMSAREIMEQIPDINIDYIKYELYYEIILGFILDFRYGELNIAENIPAEIEEEFNNKVNKVYELIKIEIKRLEKILNFNMENNYKEKETGVKSRREDDWDFKKEIEKLLDGLTDADTVEEKIYKDIEYWEKFSRVKDRGTDDIWIGESWQIAVGMLKTFINDLKQAQVTGYYKGKKIDFIAAERLNRFLLDVIKAIESDNKENGADEFNEKKIEEVKLLKSGKSVDMPIDESEQPEQGNESQRDKIRKFLKENYPNFINDPANETNLAKEFVDLTYTALQGGKKKNAINSVRIEMIGMKKGEISLDIKPKNSK